MRRACAITAGLLAALWLSAGSAFAFQETPEVAPPESAQLVAPQTQAPTVEFQTPRGTEQSDKSGAKVFSFSLLPKLDIGLELLYSHQQPMELQQGAFPDENDDLTVLGKVKRRF